MGDNTEGLEQHCGGEEIPAAVSRCLAGLKEDGMLRGFLCSGRCLYLLNCGVIMPIQLVDGIYIKRRIDVNCTNKVFGLCT